MLVFSFVARLQSHAAKKCVQMCRSSRGVNPHDVVLEVRGVVYMPFPYHPAKTVTSTRSKTDATFPGNHSVSWSLIIVLRNCGWAWVRRFLFSADFDNRLGSELQQPMLAVMLIHPHLTNGPKFNPCPCREATLLASKPSCLQKLLSCSSHLKKLLKKGGR